MIWELLNQADVNATINKLRHTAQRKSVQWTVFLRKAMNLIENKNDKNVKKSWAEKQSLTLLILGQNCLFKTPSKTKPYKDNVKKHTFFKNPDFKDKLHLQ